jgi:GeoRSP system SPASM domain protein
MKGMARGLSAPLRVYWAVAPAAQGGMDGPLAARTAGELNSLKVFFVTLRLCKGQRPDLADMIAALKPAVRVVVSVADTSAFPDDVSLSRADVLDLMPADADGLHELLGLTAGLYGTGKQLSLSVVPARDNLDFIELSLDESVRAGIRVFNLPNPDVTGPGAIPGRFVLDAASRSGLKDIIERSLGPLGDSVKLNVHDLFLHKELNLPGLGGRIEYAGCQAGDAIAYIDVSGVVYPCSSWPEPLGRLGESSFAEIWSGDARRNLREKAQKLPEECVSCAEQADCKGGCIGMAAALGRSGGRDPGCSR